MSCAVYLTCLTCEAASDDGYCDRVEFGSHRSLEASRLWAVRSEILAIDKALGGDWWEMSAGDIADGNIVSFVKNHCDHDVAIVDEYGRKYDLASGRMFTPSGKFADEQCAACGHDRCKHDDDSFTKTRGDGHCDYVDYKKGLPPAKCTCAAFVAAPDREKADGC